MKPKPFLLSLSLAAACLPTACSHHGLTGGDFGPVTAEQLSGPHTVFATGTSGAQFQWDFGAQHFKLTGIGGPVPRDVVTACLGRARVVRLIEGRWNLDGQALTLSGLTADGKDGYPDVTLHPFRTPVLRVDLNGTQYVFKTAH